MKSLVTIALASAALVLAGCAVPPPQPPQRRGLPVPGLAGRGPRRFRRRVGRGHRAWSGPVDRSADAHGRPFEERLRLRGKCRGGAAAEGQSFAAFGALSDFLASDALDSVLALSDFVSDEPDESEESLPLPDDADFDEPERLSVL